MYNVKSFKSLSQGQKEKSVLGATIWVSRSVFLLFSIDTATDAAGSRQDRGL